MVSIYKTIDGNAFRNKEVEKKINKLLLKGWQIVTSGNYSTQLELIIFNQINNE